MANLINQFSLSNNRENFPDRIRKETITIIIDKPSIRTLRFIKRISASGIGVGFLKYLIVESKITLLIEALNPLSK